MEPKYPHIEVELVGHDGNAFMILGRVAREMRKHGIDSAEIDRYHEEATAGDYDDLLRVTAEWVSIY